jgi:hypothetical protein
MENYIPDNDTIEELIGEELTDEKKAELDEMRNSPAYPDEMFEAAQREEEKKQSLFIMKLIDRYNQYYNDECSAMSHGMLISMEHLQAIAIRAVLYAFARKYNMKESIPVEDLKNLADLIEAQGKESIKKHQEVMNQAQQK